MAVTIRQVAVAGGGNGNLGPAIVLKLAEAGFEVTVLHRGSSRYTLPAGVREAAVDYASLHSLVTALEGQDAVVSTLSSQALDGQLLLIEAATKFGIKSFIPAEFGSNTVHEMTSNLPVYESKIAVQKPYAMQRASLGP